jgi:hypothetical protein
MAASAVPETTPSWPVYETARASRQSETPAPMPPWIICGCDMIIQPTMTARVSDPLRLKKGFAQIAALQITPKGFPRETIALTR